MEYDPEQPLPDSDLSSSDDATEGNTTQPAPAPVEVKRVWSHNDDFTIATTTEGDKVESFELSTLPSISASYLRFRGFTVAGAKDPAAVFGRLMTGQRIGVRGGSGKPNHWHEAIALGLIEATKKAPSGQMTPETAQAKVAAMDKETIARLKLDPKVVTHYNKLTGATVGSSLAAFLAAEAA